MVQWICKKRKCELQECHIEFCSSEWRKQIILILLASVENRPLLTAEFWFNAHVRELGEEMEWARTLEWVWSLERSLFGGILAGNSPTPLAQLKTGYHLPPCKALVQEHFEMTKCTFSHSSILPLSQLSCDLDNLESNESKASCCRHGSALPVPGTVLKTTVSKIPCFQSY